MKKDKLKSKEVLEKRNGMSSVVLVGSTGSGETTFSSAIIDPIMAKALLGKAENTRTTISTIKFILNNK